MLVKSREMTGRTHVLSWWPGGEEVKTTENCTFAQLMAIANLHVDTDKIFKGVGFPYEIYTTEKKAGSRNSQKFTVKVSWDTSSSIC